MVYGRSARGPLAILKETWTGEVAEKVILKKETDIYLKDLHENLKLAADLAKEHSEKAQDRYVKHYNKDAKEKLFKLGDSVIVLLSDSSNKLISRWIGPAQVIEILIVHAPSPHVRSADSIAQTTQHR